MKKKLRLLWFAPMFCLLFSCSGETVEIDGTDYPTPSTNHVIPLPDDSFFMLLPTNSNDFIDLPLESSNTEQIIGRWVLNKKETRIPELSAEPIILLDNDVDDFHCGISFLQFNEEVCVQNYFKKTRGICDTYSGKYSWSRNTTDNQSIDIDLPNHTRKYNVVKISETELIFVTPAGGDFYEGETFWYFERVFN